VKSVDEAILALVNGDLSALQIVTDAEHQDLLAASQRLPKLTLSRHALARVLRSLRDGAWDPKDVQLWSSFMRRGYVAGNLVGGQPSISIDYDEQDEELIIEVQSRLDEIGDMIDGLISRAELEQMLRSLEAVRAER
jgi:hypothetical protein